MEVFFLVTELNILFDGIRVLKFELLLFVNFCMIYLFFIFYGLIGKEVVFSSN